MKLDAHYVLSGMALAILGGLAFALVYHAVPQTSHDVIIYIIGAISGALTVAGGGKVADKITNSTSDTATIQPDGGDKP